MPCLATTPIPRLTPRIRAATPSFSVPTVKVIGPYRFHFYSGDAHEPRHIHVQRDDATAKFWLEPARRHSSRGFSRTELARIQKLVQRHRPEFIAAWNDYFDTH